MKPLSIPFKFGILTAIGLIAYFLFLGLLNVNTNPFFSFFNGVIYASFLALALRNFNETEPEKNDFKTIFEIPFFTGIIATIIFSVFFVSYYSYVPHFAEGLLKNIGKFASTGGIFLTVVTMGVVTSLIISFGLMQLHKRKRIKVMPEDKNAQP